MSGPRKGSMADRLINLKDGESTLFEAVPGCGNLRQQQINACASRNGLTGKLRQQIFIGVSVTDRQVIDIVRVTRFNPDQSCRLNVKESTQ